MNASTTSTLDTHSRRYIYMHRNDDATRPKFMYVDDNEQPVLCLTNFMNDLSDNASLSLGTLDQYSRKIRDIATRLLNSPKCLGLESSTLDDIAPLLTLADFDQLYLDQSREGATPNTMRSTETVVRRWTNWMATENGGRRQHNAMYEGERPHTPRPHRRIPHYLEASEITALTRALNFECQRVLVQFGLDTMLRASEFPSILKKDIPIISSFGNSEWQKMTIRGVKGKGGYSKERIVNVSRATVARIHAYHSHPEYLMASGWSPREKPAFLNTQGQPWTRSAIGKFISRAARKVPVLAEKLPIYPHLALRHTGARNVMNTPDSGDNASDRLDALQSILGHADQSTTEIYKNTTAADYGGNAETVWRYELAANLARETALPRRQQPKIPEGLRKNGKS